jgi:hypothetical protein
MPQNKPLIHIGRAEAIQLLDHGPLTVVAKIDTGADISSIWASEVKEQGGSLSFKLFGPGHPDYTGEVITLAPNTFTKTRIANSFGHREVRYVAKLRIKLKGRIVKATFSLADRSEKLYPILIGRRLLKGKFIVDVSAGDPLHHKEKIRKRKLRLELDGSGDKVEP